MNLLDRKTGVRGTITKCKCYWVGHLVNYNPMIYYYGTTLDELSAAFTDAVKNINSMSVDEKLDSQVDRLVNEACADFEVNKID